MHGLAGASVVGFVLSAAWVTPARAQVDARPASNPGAVHQSVAVPVFPGQMLDVRVALPAGGETPLPSVLLLIARAPGGPPVAASVALSDALLARGVAVVQLDVPPATIEVAERVEPITQPADDAFAVLQYMRDREDMDGYRVALVGVGEAAAHAARATSLDEGLRALVLLGAADSSRESLDLPTGLPLMALPLEVRAAPLGEPRTPTPIHQAADFLVRHLQ